MQIKLTADDWRLARDIHKRFSWKTGSKHIATKFALAHLSAVLRTTEIRSVLEFGAGIGTISYLLLNELPNDVQVECTEHSDFCRSQLSHNIPSSLYERLIIHETKQPMLKNQFDLVIIDGSVSRDTGFFADGSICFVEGNRRGIVDRIQRSLAERGLTCHFVNYMPRRKIAWRLTRFYIPRTVLKPVKGCWISRVQTIPNSTCHSVDDTLPSAMNIHAVVD